MLLREQVPLAPYTTFGIGGAARWFAEATDEQSVAEAVCLSRERGLPLFVLGGGSNVLVSDEGFPGLVLYMALRGVEQEGDLFRAAAGENWDEFVSLAVRLGFGGVECMAGIPGTVGGTPVQNVGAYGQEAAETIEKARAFDRRRMQFVELRAEECGFAYRQSIFNSTERERYIVTRVDYRLRKDAAATIRYADLKRHFANSPGAPSLAEVAAAVREIRRGKGMLLVEGDPDCRSAGSFFKNPVVAQGKYDQIASLCSEPVPAYPATEGSVKLSAAWLIERSGFAKGLAMGRAGISSRHTLALINRGGATASEIVALRDRIVAGVEQRFGVHLEPEPVWLGNSK